MAGGPIRRLLVICACLLGAATIGARAMRPELTPPRESLNQMPLTIGDWTGHEAPALSADVLGQLGVDEYLNRIYVTDDLPLSLYVGYYRSQREGDTIHSPQNCLPGAGWLPVSTSRMTLPVDGRPAPVTINRLLIQKGLDRQIVLYWYQSHGRVVASEYWSKVHLVTDAIRLNRSDAAIVRIVSPVLPGETDDTAAELRAVAFAQEAFPQIDRLLPM